MPVVNPGEIWWVDFGLAAKVRPALLLTGNPAACSVFRQGASVLCAPILVWDRAARTE